MFYHVGKAGLLEILPGRSHGFTEAGSWADRVYKIRPIYFSVRAGMYPISRGMTEYVIDESMLDTEKLRADLPSLVDVGMYLKEDFDANVGSMGEAGWWEEGKEPKALKPYLDEDGEILLAELSRLWRPAIEVTGTVAYLGNISLSPPRLHKKRRGDRLEISDTSE